MEHALLNYLYLSLYFEGKPAVLHFNLDGQGKRWSRFDPEELKLPRKSGDEL